MNETGTVSDSEKSEILHVLKGTHSLVGGISCAACNLTCKLQVNLVKHNM
jgi:hypothetical protein